MKTAFIAGAALGLLVAPGAYAQETTTEQTTTTTTTTKTKPNPAPPSTVRVQGENATTEVTNLADGQTVINVTVNNDAVAFDKSAMPMMLGGRVMVPLRGVVERLGGNVKYESATKVITGAQPNLERQFRLRLNSPEALLNGKNLTLDAPARVLRGTTYVPLRFVSEALGADVRWDAAKRTVTIMADGYSADVKTGG
jgi:hypothetical protein